MIVKAPEKYYEEAGLKKIFFAGSIEMGKAELWQDRLAKDIQHEERDIVIFNPRRDDWDSSWEQSIDNYQFKKQVDWELDSIDRSELVVFYFDKGTMSPITLMELGYVAARSIPAVVYCPEGFWRKGNVDVMCFRENIPMAETYEDLVSFIKTFFWRRYK